MDTVNRENRTFSLFRNPPPPSKVKTLYYIYQAGVFVWLYKVQLISSQLMKDYQFFYEFIQSFFKVRSFHVPEKFLVFSEGAGG